MMWPLYRGGSLAFPLAILLLQFVPACRHGRSEKIDPTASMPSPEATHQDRDSCIDAKKVLLKFLELEQAGRIWSEALTQLITDTDGPGWDEQVVVSDLELGACQETDRGILFSVEYRVEGQMTSLPGSGYPTFITNPSTSQVVYTVVLGGGSYRVTQVGDLPPHITPTTAKLQFERLEIVAESIAAKAEIRRAIDRMVELETHRNPGVNLNDR